MKEPRPSRDDMFLNMCLLVATRATCARRKVGCVLVSSQGHVLSTGYNGPAAKQPHCVDQPCPGANAKSGESLDLCEALHSEQNAMLQCRDVREIMTCYCTTAPCVTCTKLLMNTGCKEIVFLEDYPQSAESRRLWESSGEPGWKRAWRQSRVTDGMLHSMRGVIQKLVEIEGSDLEVPPVP